MPMYGHFKYMQFALRIPQIAGYAVQVALSSSPAVEPSRPALFRSPFLAFALDSHYFQPVEACSDTFDHYRAVNVAHDMAIRLKLPFPAAMNHKDEPARLAAHDTLHGMKRA